MEKIPSRENDSVGKETKVVEFLKQKIEKARNTLDSFESEVSYFENWKPTTDRASLPDKPVGDGGMDISDWKVEAGIDKQESSQRDYFTSADALDELTHLKDIVSGLEEDLREIEQGDERKIQSYWTELSTLQK